jgi:hypothetical protein
MNSTAYETVGSSGAPFWALLSHRLIKSWMRFLLEQDALHDSLHLKIRMAA